PTSADDQAVMAYLNTKFAADGYKLPALLRAIALSNAFSQVRNVEPATKAADAPSSQIAAK
ncbi:MAG: hypothetical protein ACYCZX_19095, partial [Rhodospirillaceae bacterium]